MTALAKKTAVPASRTHAVRRAEAERRMLEAAVELIANRGFSGFTLNEVGEAAGYSRALPAHYFKTKERMVALVADHLVRSFNTSLGNAVIEPGLPGLLKVADAYLRRPSKETVGVRALMILLTEAMSNLPLAEMIAHVNARSIASIAGHIRAGQAAGDIRPEINPKVQAALILGQWRGVLALWLTAPEGLDLNRLRIEVLSTLKWSLSP